MIVLEINANLHNINVMQNCGNLHQSDAHMLLYLRHSPDSDIYCILYKIPQDDAGDACGISKHEFDLHTSHLSKCY